MFDFCVICSSQTSVSQSTPCPLKTLSDVVISWHECLLQLRNVCFQTPAKSSAGLKLYRASLTGDCHVRVTGLVQ